MVQGSYGSDLVGTGRTRMANAVKIQKVEKQSTSDAEKKKKFKREKKKLKTKISEHQIDGRQEELRRETWPGNGQKRVRAREAPRSRTI